MGDASHSTAARATAGDASRVAFAYWVSDAPPMRFSPRWVVVGAVAMIGCLWFAVQLLTLARLQDPSCRYIAMVAFPAAMGALIVGFAPVRPWREPALAVVTAFVLSIAVLAASSLGRAALEGSLFTLLLQWGLVLVGAVLGAAAMRRFAPRFHAGPASIVILSAVLTMGIAVSAMALEATLFPDTGGLRFITMTASIVLAGFLTQGSIEVRRPWLCGGGVLLLVLKIMTGPANWTVSDLVFGAAALAGLGSIGARLAWRRMVRRGHREDIAVPAAHIS